MGLAPQWVAFQSETGAGAYIRIPPEMMGELEKAGPCTHRTLLRWLLGQDLVDTAPPEFLNCQAVLVLTVVGTEVDSCCKTLVPNEAVLPGGLLPSVSARYGVDHRYMQLVPVEAGDEYHKWLCGGSSRWTASADTLRRIAELCGSSGTAGAFCVI